MKRFFHCVSILLLFELAFASRDTLYYDVTVFGIRCGKISYSSEKENISITALSSGLIEYFYPFKNYYHTSFDTLTFGIRNYKKTTKQGDFKQRLSGEWDSSTENFTYDGLDSFKRGDSCMTVFTFLERLNRENSEQLDTKWFPIEHEGSLFKSRVLLAGTEKILINGDSIMSNHLRLDLIPDDKEIKMLDRSDYFSQNITHPEAIKQIWVERKPPGKILKASVKIGPITITATITDK